MRVLLFYTSIDVRILLASFFIIMSSGLYASPLLEVKVPISRALEADNNTSVKIMPNSEYDLGSHRYFSKLLALSLEKTEQEFGVTTLEEVSQHLVQQRALQQLHQEGMIDVYWTVTTKQREVIAIPVRVPLLKGIMGYRVGLIRASNVDTFNQMSSADDLKSAVAGQGHDWPDFEILNDNGFKVLGTSVYDSLIELLLKQRIDYYPRAINETVAEYAFFDNPDLAIEPRFLIYYPSYIFFFVSPSQPKLADRIQRGLRIALQDGSFDRAFRDYVNIEQLKAELKLNNRIVLELKNNSLSEQTAAIQRPNLLNLMLNKEIN